MLVINDATFYAKNFRYAVLCENCCRPRRFLVWCGVLELLSMNRPNYEGRPINKLQNSIILLIFKI